MQSTALRYFCEVVRCGSLRRAAEVLHIAPSAISRQIVHLEYRIKAPLFERQTNKLVLTEEGKIMAQHAEVIDLDFRRALAAIDDISKLRRGSVRIATVEAMVGQILPKAIAAYQSTYPNLTVDVDVLGTDDVVEAVVRDTVDLGIAFCPSERDDVEVRREYAQPLHAIVSPKYRLSASAGISLSDLSQFRVALPYESFGIRRLVESVAQSTPVNLLRVFETSSIELVKGLVRHSNAITFLPRAAVLQDVEHGLLAAIPMLDPELRATCVKVLCMKGRTLSKAAEAFLDVFDGIAKLAMH